MVEEVKVVVEEGKEGVQEEEVVIPPEEWSCEACTFINPIENATCEICGTNRPEGIVRQPSQSTEPSPAE